MKKIAIILIICALVFTLVPGINATSASSRYIVVDKSYRLLLVKNGQSIEQVIPVCVGSSGENETPAGNYAVVSIVHHPNWYFEGKTYAPYPGEPQNGLGVLWMGISKPSYGLHGTNEPFSPGMNLSHGCVRMNNSDVTKLTDISFIGEKVEIREGSQDNFSKHLEAITILYNINNILKEAD